MTLSQLRGDVAKVGHQLIAAGPDARLRVGPKAALVIGVGGSPRFCRQELRQRFKGHAVVIEAVDSQDDLPGIRPGPDPCDQARAIGQVKTHRHRR